MMYCLKSVKPICRIAVVWVHKKSVLVDFMLNGDHCCFLMPVLVNALSFCYSRNEVMLLNII